MHEGAYESYLVKLVPFGQVWVPDFKVCTIFCPAVPNTVLLLMGAFDHACFLSLDCANVISHDVMSCSGSKFFEEGCICVGKRVDNKIV